MDPIHVYDSSDQIYQFNFTRPQPDNYPILEYDIQIFSPRVKDFTKLNCEGNNFNQDVEGLFCLVNRTTLATYENFTAGDAIQAKVKARNKVGWALEYSPVNTHGPSFKMPTG